MNEKPKNKAAVALGRLNKGKKKVLSDKERARRSAWAGQMTVLRMAKRQTGVINEPCAE